MQTEEIITVVLIMVLAVIWKLRKDIATWIVMIIVAKTIKKELQEAVDGDAWCKRISEDIIKHRENEVKLPPLQVELDDRIHILIARISESMKDRRFGFLGIRFSVNGDIDLS